VITQSINSNDASPICVAVYLLVDAELIETKSILVVVGVADFR